MQPKLKLLKILDILRETSETNPLTAPAICAELDKMGIAAERKSVCRDINTLIDYGYEIKLCHDNKKGYYMVNKEEKKAPAPHKPSMQNLIKITLECKKDDAKKVEAIFGKGKKTEDGDYLLLEFDLSSDSLFANLFAVGTIAKITEPAELKEEFERKLQDTADFYKRRRDNGRMDVWLL